MPQTLLVLGARQRRHRQALASLSTAAEPEVPGLAAEAARASWQLPDLARILASRTQASEATAATRDALPPPTSWPTEPRQELGAWLAACGAETGGWLPEASPPPSQSPRTSSGFLRLSFSDPP